MWLYPRFERGLGMFLNEALAVVIRGVRKSRGLSQEDFKSIDRSYLARIEAGRANVSVEVLQGIASMLGLEVEMLVILAVGVQTQMTADELCEQLSRKIGRLAEEGILLSIAEAGSTPRTAGGRRRTGDAIHISAEVRRLRAEGFSLSKIAQVMNLSKTTIHRYLSA